MQVRVMKEKGRAEIEELVADMTRKHRSLSSLSQKVSINKCSSHESMTDFIIWKGINDGADYVEEIIFENSDIFDTLSPRRIDLMEYLSKHEPKSIRQLSEKLNRNYKNVYDDLHALEEYSLIDLLPSGRMTRPVCSVTEIETVFGE